MREKFIYPNKEIIHIKVNCGRLTARLEDKKVGKESLVWKYENESSHLSHWYYEDLVLCLQVLCSFFMAHIWAAGIMEPIFNLKKHISVSGRTRTIYFLYELED